MEVKDHTPNTSLDAYANKQDSALENSVQENKITPEDFERDKVFDQEKVDIHSKENILDELKLGDETEEKKYPEPVRSEFETKLRDLWKTPFVQKGIPYLVLGINTIGNLVATVCNSLPLPKVVQDSMYQLGHLSSTVTMVVNSIVGSAGNFFKRNSIIGLGQMAEAPFALFLPFKKFFLARGVSTSAFLMGQALNRWMGRKDFSSNMDCFKSALAGLKKGLPDFKKPHKNFLNADSGMLSFFNGALMLAGCLIGFLGDFKTGVRIRSAAAMLQSFDRLVSYKIRPKYFIAGLCHLSTALLSQIKSMVPEHFERMLTPLILMGDGIGKHCYRVSIEEGEHVRKVSDEENTFMQAIKFIKNIFVPNSGIAGTTA